MAYDPYGAVKPEDPRRKSFLMDTLRRRLVWASGKPRRAEGKIVDEIAKLNREEAWDEVLDKIVALRKDGTVGRTTIKKLRDENPYRRV